MLPAVCLSLGRTACQDSAQGGVLLVSAPSQLLHKRSTALPHHPLTPHPWHLESWHQQEQGSFHLHNTDYIIFDTTISSSLFVKKLRPFPEFSTHHCPRSPRHEPLNSPTIRRAHRHFQLRPRCKQHSARSADTALQRCLPHRPVLC